MALQVAKAQLMRPLGALEAAVENRRFVLLGAPGSGKSTFVRYLAFCLAMKELPPEGGWLQRLPQWPQEECDALPVVVVLRDFARWCAGQRETGQEPGGAGTVGRFLERWLRDRDLADFAAPLRQALRDGEAIVFFDGLDEIPTQDQRASVRDAIVEFARTYDAARIVVTCRTLSYQDPAWQLPTDRFPVFELAPLDEDKIDRFIEVWYRELSQIGAVRAEEVGTLIAKLRQAVQRPDICRLAPNPLLLTVMALVHTHQGRLPEARALLYEECTDLLLWRWEEVKAQGGEARASGLRRLLQEADLQDVDFKRALWALAFDAHRGDGGRQDEATADITEAQLLRALRTLHPTESWDWAAAVVEQIKERAGLLVEREREVYAFPHRTFQEYLAACCLSVQVDFARQAAALSEEAAFWREVALLAVGRQVHVAGDLARPLALAAELCPSEDPADEGEWRAAWLAGEVLAEAGARRVQGQGTLGRELLARVRGRLAALVGDGHLAPRERAEVGDVLGRLGDPRPGVGVVVLAEGHPPIPDVVWVEVPGGPFVMGSRKRDQEANDSEKPQQRLEMPYHYWLARYPVTVAQYGCFLEAGGCEEPRWWTMTGWAWRQGEWDSQVEDTILRDWLRRRPAELRRAPMWWGDQREHANRPVMGVSWFEAVAFCRWLTEQLRSADRPLQIWCEGDLSALQFDWSNLRVRLPTEAEWEKAARSGDARRYPWGDEDWDPQRANVWEGGIRRVTSVGMCPLGETPSGLLDLAGNVWEWTASLYQPYPYRSADGRNDLEADGDRVVRGGSWLIYRRNARCAIRSRLIPDYWDNNLGFRLGMSLASSEF